MYTDDDIERLRLVKAFEPLEFSLREMRDLLGRRDRLQDQLASVDARAQVLSREAELARRAAAGSRRS